MAYHLNPDRRCPVCWRYGLDPEHLKSCIPRRYWPQETETAAGPIATAVTVALSTAQPEESHPDYSGVTDIPGMFAAAAHHAANAALAGLQCDCGYVAKNAQALRMHRMKAKQHQEEAAAGSGVQLTDAGGRLRSSSPRVTSDYDTIVPLPNGEFLPEAS